MKFFILCMLFISTAYGQHIIYPHKFPKPESFSSIKEANSVIKRPHRYIGLIVQIKNSLYWYRDGVEDSDLIEKPTRYYYTTDYDTFYVDGSYIWIGDLPEVGSNNTKTGLTPLPDLPCNDASLMLAIKRGDILQMQRDSIKIQLDKEKAYSNGLKDGYWFILDEMGRNERLLQNIDIFIMANIRGANLKKYKQIVQTTK